MKYLHKNIYAPCMYTFGINLKLLVDIFETQSLHLKICSKFQNS